MNVYLSPLAEKKALLLIKYPEAEWSTKTKEEFVSKLLGKFLQISSQPESCTESTVFSGLYKMCGNKTDFIFLQN